jgi:hypothetical protein
MIALILGLLVMCLPVGLALTADRSTQYKEGVEVYYPVAATTKIFSGGMVCLNATGFAVPAADTVNFTFVGVARQYVDNSLGGDGDKTVIVRRKGLFLFKATSINQAAVGKIMYIKDDETFDETSSQLIVAGRLVEWVTNNMGWLDIDCAIFTGATFGASTVSIADAGAYFPAATDTVEEAIQELSKGPHIITIPRFTGWTKDATPQTVAIPLVESPVPIRIKRAYCNLGTPPGADKTLVLKVNTSTVVTIAGTDTKGEAEALNIAIAADTDIVVTATETAEGAAANADLILVVYRDDGE